MSCRVQSPPQDPCFRVRDQLRVWGHRPRVLRGGGEVDVQYRDTSITRKHLPLGLYRMRMPRVLEGSWGAGRFLMGEAPHSQVKLLVLEDLVCPP